MKKLTVTLLMLLLINGSAFTQFNGDTDPMYGNSGKFWYNFNGGGTEHNLRSIALDENNSKMYISGTVLFGTSGVYDALIVKSDLDGTLDPLWSSGSLLVDPYIGADDVFQSVAIQDNGKIVVAGHSLIGPSDSQLIINRYNEDGQQDPTFNSGGAILLGGSGIDYTSKVLVQDDGKIVLVGMYAGPADMDIFILRLNSDGSLDGTFGGAGIAYFDDFQGEEIVLSATLLANGGIAVVGKSEMDGILLVCDENGDLDQNFSQDGLYNFQMNSLATIVTNVVELDDLSLLVCGYTNEQADGETGFITKFSPNGNSLLNFNGNEGYLDLKFEETNSSDTTFTVNDMEVFSTGQILVSGKYETDTKDIALVLINADGTLDTSFGTDGYRVYDLSGSNSDGTFENLYSDIEIASSGEVYVSAQVRSSSLNDIVTVRLMADQSGLQDQQSELGTMELYPNPAGEELILQLTTTDIADVQIEIIDISGRTLNSKEMYVHSIGENKISLRNEIAGLTSGIYYVRATSGGRVAQKQIIKR